jgi:ABC-type multidrug transport system fused ATPase/permease subunit
LIDDNPLTTINVQWLRSTVGLVNQQPILLPGSIHDNIAVGKTGATRAEVEEAAALANADQFIMALDDG